MVTFDQALDARRGPPKLARVAPSKRFDEFCAKHRVPRELARVLSRHSFTRWIDFGAVTFDPVNAIPRANGGRNARCIAQRLLVVGSGRNGDPVVVDLRDRSPTMAFVRHDEFWEDDEIAPRDCLTKAPIGLATFFFAAAKLADFPCDSYALDELPARYWKNIEQRALRATAPIESDDPDDDDDDAPALHRAALAHRVDEVRKLLASGTDVMARDALGATALHYAVREPENGKRTVARQVAVVCALLAAGADVDARDGEGSTPLLDAVLGMRSCSPVFAPSGPAMTRELVKAGADKNRTNKHRLSPAKLASDVSFRLDKWLRV